MEVDFTQWWVPASAMVVLGMYVFYSGFQEYRLPTPVAPAETSEIFDEATPAVSSTRKRGFLMRTSWIWGSVLIGAAAQVYLSFAPA